MALFESYERRIDQINAVLNSYGISSIEEAEKITKDAGLDVYEEESEYFYEDVSDKIIDDDTLARLLSFNNVIVTSHQAFFTKEALVNIANTTLQNIKDFHEGKIENEVTIS